jgi:hypothetical protein
MQRKLPQLIANPEMVISNADGVRSGDNLVTTSETVEDGRPAVAAFNRAGTTAKNEAATVVVTVFPKGRLNQLLAKVERDGSITYVKTKRKGDGYKHIGANSRNAPISGTVSRLRASQKRLAYNDVFKPKSSPGLSEDTRLKTREDAEVAKFATQPRSKVLLLSATPFAYDKSLVFST